MGSILPEILTGHSFILLAILFKRVPVLRSSFDAVHYARRRDAFAEHPASFLRRHLLVIGAIWMTLAVISKRMGQGELLPLVYTAFLPMYIAWMCTRAGQLTAPKN